MDNDFKAEICSRCFGAGTITVQGLRYTREMALDAEDPSIEGMIHGYEYSNCPNCNGSGYENGAKTDIEIVDMESKLFEAAGKAAENFGYGEGTFQRAVFYTAIKWMIKYLNGQVRA